MILLEVLETKEFYVIASHTMAVFVVCAIAIVSWKYIEGR
ncbi:hypothetical protein HNQ88_003804 [Aureibacter tunicatorum]|uniref:Uncharacterized protein n=1 Tax=Aureibacter tunicatorum TaxID=866807 RepID=A0AAE3XRI3_9BACT|nr:hypothetical protein [Aureibacter tunicatorum]BDD06939.1 hypothetical protein AUTU_44220 [Aureibacter tunicatorum]